MKIIFAIIEQAAMYMPLMLGAYVSIALLKAPDLSLESAFTFGAISAAKIAFFTKGFPFYLAACAAFMSAFVGGALVGVISSSLTCFMRLPHLLSSIVTIGIFYGINQIVLGTSNISLSQYALLQIKLIPGFVELPVFLVSAVVLISFMAFLLKTPLGYCYAIYGENARFFAYHKISSAYVFMTGIALSNGLAGVAGFLFSQANGFVDVSMGVGIPLLAIMALLLGKFFLQKRKLSITAVGIIVYFILQQLLLKVGFNLRFFPLVQACVILVVLAIKRHDSQESVNHLGI